MLWQLQRPLGSRVRVGRRAKRTVAIPLHPGCRSSPAEQIADGEPLNDFCQHLFARSAHALTEWVFQAYFLAWRSVARSTTSSTCCACVAP
jgi:hypothetical protein